MKIIKSGLHGKVIKVLRSMYNKTRARMKINGVLYDWIKDQVGMNQGGPNSPNLFRKFLADLGNYLSMNYGVVLSDETILLHLLWADDLILLSDSVKGLQIQLDGLFNFCKDSMMIVNETKTKIMVFGNAEKNPSFSYNNKTLDVVNQYKYLGILFNTCQSLKANIFKDAVDQISLKATRAIFKIKKDTKVVGKLPPGVLFKLFDSLVMPILEYGSEIFFRNKESLQLEKVQLKFLKMSLSVNSNTSTLAVYGDTGRHNLFVRQCSKAIKYWSRIVQMKNDSLVKMVYDGLLDLDNAGFNNWCTNIRICLCDLGYENLWNDQMCNDISLKCIKDTLKSNFEQNWLQEICNDVKNPKLRTYSKFKPHFGVEPYLLSIIDPKLVKCMARFRLSCHTLEVEKGRHSKPKTPLEQRTCKHCNLNAIEDEHHFLMICPKYKLLRQEFFNIRTSLNLPNNFLDIMKCDKTTFYLGKVISKMFRERDLENRLS